MTEKAKKFEASPLHAAGPGRRHGLEGVMP